jgi:hypothetical protein
VCYHSQGPLRVPAGFVASRRRVAPTHARVRLVERSLRSNPQVAPTREAGIGDNRYGFPAESAGTVDRKLRPHAREGAQTADIVSGVCDRRCPPRGRRIIVYRYVQIGQLHHTRCGVVVGSSNFRQECIPRRGMRHFDHACWSIWQFHASGVE